MKNCEYIIDATGDYFDSYKLLLQSDWLNNLNKDEWRSLEDIIFSESPLADLIASKLKNKNHEYHVDRIARNSLAGVVDGEPDLSADNAMPINGFLESDLCAVNGKRIVTLKNDEDYETSFIRKLTKQAPPGTEITLEEAKAEFDKHLKGNDIIVEDSVMLHSLLTSSEIISTESSAIYNFSKAFKEVLTSRFEGNSLLADLLFNGLRNGYFNRIIKRNLKVVKNINLRSKLAGIDKDLIGHIDYITIEPNGTLHLYLYKVSSQDYKKWPSAKVEKYKAQLVFLKYMLAENGFNVKNIELNIVPIALHYTDDYSKVTHITVHDPVTYSSRKSDGTYALEHYDLLVRHFLKDNYMPDEITNSDIENANKDIKKIFPVLNVQTEGFSKTAEEWIRTAPDCDPHDIEPLVIKEVHTPGHGYDLIVRLKDDTTKTIVIKSDRAKRNNKELQDAVIEHLLYLSDNKSYLLNRLKEAIKNGYTKGKTNVFSDIKGLPPIFLNSIFSKYLTTYTTKENGEKDYEWKLLDNLSEANVLMFQNKKGLVDVISLSAFNLNVSPTLKEGTTNVLGCHRYDSQTAVFKGDFGNIELIRVLTLLNLIAPSLGKDFKLGKILVINTLSESQRAYSASYLNRALFSEIVEVVNKENPDSPIHNNLSKCAFVDEVGVLMNEYLSIIDGESMTDALKYQYTSLGFDILETASKDTRELALFNIMSNIYEARSEFNDPNKVIEASKYGEEKNRNLAKLLILASEAYLAVRGETALHQSVLPSMDSLSFTALTVPDLNIRIAAENLLITNDMIASEFMELFTPANKDFETFFNAVGYTQAEGVVLGDEANLFSNLYDPDNELFSFKNPYDMSNKLTDPERIILKKILLAMAKIRTHDNFEFDDYNSPKLAEWIKSNPWYLWVPLEKASKATLRLTFRGIKAAMKYMKNLLTNSKDRFEDTMENLLSEEAEELESGFSRLLLTNLFSLSIPLDGDISKAANSRRKLLLRGRDFYETNLKNIYIDFLFRSIATDLYNKYLISTKALMLSMLLTNDMGGNKETLEKELQHIRDYLKVNVFLRSIMEPKSKKVISWILPIKSAITNLLLMGNVVSFFRDCIQGVLENFTRSVIKFNTNISPKSVAKAYTYVTTHSTSNARAINLLSKLCLRYRLSNTDVARIAERAKSARNGLYNWDNIAYGTLRSPDFLNRMTLFVAKCMEDGCWDAWYLTEDGDLRYNWRKDTRFNLLATDNNSDPVEYAKQRSLYLSKIRDYNKDHPDKEPLELSLTTDLPSPYSNREILSIRAVADNIYGSYDKSKKSMYENWAFGVSIGMFTTWFNGIYNNYFAKSGLYATSKLKRVQDTDPETGLLLYFDIKKHEITVNPVSDDGTPNDIVWKDIPIVTQGIFPTLSTLYYILKNDGKDALKQYLNANEGERQNIIKLISDLIMLSLFVMLFKVALNADWYKDEKKKMRDLSIILNLVTEVLYKSSSRAFDSFMGPLNIIEQLGNNMNPPYYSAPIKLLKDTYSTIFGEKQFVTLMTDNLGFARAFKDTYRAELKKNL